MNNTRTGAPRTRYADPDEAARTAGRQDGLGGVMDHAARYPQGEPGHGDYMLGRAEGEEEAARVMQLGEGAPGHANGAGEAAPRRGRGRPRKPRQEAGAEA